MGSSVDVTVHPGGTYDVELLGLPTSYSFDVSFDVKDLVKLQIGSDPITIEPLTINPVDFTLRIKELPSIRTHLPANFALGFSIFGFEVLCARLCGEAQVITEPYEPNPCERCGELHERVPVRTHEPSGLSG